VLTALVVAWAALLAVAEPAAAHDELVSTDPAAGSEVAALPSTLTLAFSGELLGGEGANEVQVTDASGATLNDGPTAVDGTTVTQALAGDAVGSIQVLWRVVSSDGHPISGEFSFTVADSAAPTAPGAPTTTPPQTPTPGASAEASPSATPTTAEEPADPWPWIIGAVILMLVIALVVYLLVVRPRRAEPGSGTGADR
jgi:methionine-rich copper-binding protein CopC